MDDLAVAEDTELDRGWWVWAYRCCPLPELTTGR